MTLHNLGFALENLGQAEARHPMAGGAVDAYRAALQVRTHERVPLEWALTMNNLGSVFSELGERDGGTHWLEEAVKAYESALEAVTELQAAYQVTAVSEDLEIAQFALAQHSVRRRWWQLVGR